MHLCDTVKPMCHSAPSHPFPRARNAIRAFAMTMTPIVSPTVSPRERSAEPPVQAEIHRLENIRETLDETFEEMYILSDRPETKVVNVSPRSTARGKRADVWVDPSGGRGAIVGVVVKCKPAKNRFQSFHVEELAGQDSGSKVSQVEIC